MTLLGGLAILAIFLLAGVVGLIAKRHPEPTAPDDETDITEREWMDAIR